jgi:hypothetical protein
MTIHCKNIDSAVGHVCFPEFIFWEIIFQIFLYLFVIKKVGQRKTLSGQRKHFSVNGKYFPVNGNTFRSTKNTFQSTETLFEFGLVFRKVFSLLAVFVFRKVISGKPLSKLSCVCLPLEKLVNGKHFPVKGKFGLVFRKVFSWKIWAENTFQKL